LKPGRTNSPCPARRGGSRTPPLSIHGWKEAEAFSSSHVALRLRIARGAG
jgi:hypothetical protein